MHEVRVEVDEKGEWKEKCRVEAESHFRILVDGRVIYLFIAAAEEAEKE